jgi:hypothetical protein
MHWALEMVGVACTPWQEAGWGSTVLPASTGYLMYWRIYGNGWHMQGLSATYVVWLEIPNWVLIDSNRRYFLDMETGSLPIIVVTSIPKFWLKQS